MSKSRLEKFLYALYSLDSSDLPTPLSRIEELYKCLVTGDEAPTFKPISRVEKYLMVILGGYDVDSLPNPLSRVEVLLYKLATGDDNLDDVEIFLSEHEELLADIIRNGGTGGNIDIEYVLYNLSTEFNTLYNTAEKPVKSAILKGNTLVNLCNASNRSETLTSSSRIFYCKIPYTIKANSVYTFFAKISNSTTSGQINLQYAHPDGTYSYPKIMDASTNGVVNLHIVNAKDITNIIIYISNTDTGQVTVSDVMIIEGDYANVNVPYFEGMQSVKMPVLKTTGKNLFDINSMSNINNWDTVVSSEIPYCSYKINLKPNTTYKFTQKQFVSTENVYASFGLKKGGFEYLLAIAHPTSQYPTTLTLTTDDRGLIYVKLYKADTTLETFISKLSNNQLQLEESSTATLYEPFKSNILTVNEDVTLRSNGDVYDELNLLTGRLIQRIDENNEVLAQEVVKTVDLSVVDQDGNNTELSTFNDLTHVTLSSEGLIPEAELEVATKNEEVLNTMSLEMDDISKTQNGLQETLDTQSENVDSTMIATTEIYEGLL